MDEETLDIQRSPAVLSFKTLAEPVLQRGAMVDLVSGTAAGVSQLCVGHPFDTVKVKVQISTQNVGALDVTRSILNSKGPLGFYKGMGAPMATVALFNAVLFSTWGGLERWLGHKDGAPLTLGEQCLAGGLAGVPVSILATPTELLKCRLQAQACKAPSAGRQYTLEEVKAGKAVFDGPMAVMRNVLRHEGGVPGLLRGFVPTLLREVPGNAAYFGVYHAAKQQLASMQGLHSPADLGPGSLMAAGGVAGAAFWLSCYPADVIKSKLQTDNFFNPRYRGTLDCARQLVGSHGWRGLWVGFGPCLARSVPANAAAFLTFEMVRTRLG